MGDDYTCVCIGYLRHLDTLSCANTLSMTREDCCYEVHTSCRHKQLPTIILYHIVLGVKSTHCNYAFERNDAGDVALRRSNGSYAW